MRVISCNVENFASYKKLGFNMTEQGLTLVHGHTGSGKSTLCDITPWVLFGKTAKGGAVDEVLSWPGNETAKGEVTLEVNSERIVVTRIRGKGKNDLYFNRHSGTRIPIRGKDLADTQKLLNNFLGIDSELYLSGAYFHEFSQTAQFFTTTAKNRRTITEQLVDLSLPKKLQERITPKAKELKQALSEKSVDAKFQAERVEELTAYLNSAMFLSDGWEANRAKRAEELLEKSESFQADKISRVTKLKLSAHGLDVVNNESIDTLIGRIKGELSAITDTVCVECGAPKPNAKREELSARLLTLNQNRLENSYKLRELRSIQQQLKTLEAQENPYEEQIATIADESNPYDIKGIESKLTVATTKLYELQQAEKTLQVEKSDLEILSDIVADFRGILIENTVLDIEDSTNLYLHNHFDAEIKIELSVEDADKLEVSILKDGNKCVYTQLSKGQRQLLKLSFGVAVMKAVSNHHGISFKQAFFDEALDGLDDNFKAKAFKLLQILSTEYDSIFVVEHSNEFKNLFPNKYKVELINGESHINAEI